MAAAAKTIVIALAGLWRTRLLRTLSWANQHTGLSKDHTSSVLGAAAESQQILHQAQEGQRNNQQSHKALHRIGVTETHTESGYHPVGLSTKGLTLLLFNFMARREPAGHQFTHLGCFTEPFCSRVFGEIEA